MKITRNTRDVLMAEENPWGLAIALFIVFATVTGPAVSMIAGGGWMGALALAVGGGVSIGLICIFVERVQLILDAPADHVVIRRRTILRHVEIILPLSDLREALVETSRTRARLTRTSLILNDPVRKTDVIQPVTEVYSTGFGATRLARAVNAWLEQQAA